MSFNTSDPAYLAALLASIKRKIFVSYQHTVDQGYYDGFSKAFHDNYECVFDNSLERIVDSDNVDYVIQRIRDKHITGTSCTIVLVGITTHERKYIDWETKATLDKEHGLIGIQLPTAPVSAQNTVSVPLRLSQNITSGYALWKAWGDLTSPAVLKGWIEDAISRDKWRIVNSKEIKKKNG